MNNFFQAGASIGAATLGSHGAAQRIAPLVVLIFIIIFAALFGWRNWNEANCERHPESERCVIWRGN